MKQLRGIVLREDGDTLVVQATDADVLAFASPGLAVTVEADRATPPWDDLWFQDMGEPLYDRHGRAVARVTEVIVESAHWNGPFSQHSRVRIRAEGLSEDMSAALSAPRPPRNARIRR